MADHQKKDTYHIVHKYWSVACDLKHHSLLCEDKTCLQFLVFVLDDHSEEITIEALKTLLLLCEKTENRKKVCDTYGLLQSLELLLSNRNNSDEILKLASELLIVMNTLPQKTVEKGSSHHSKSTVNRCDHVDMGIHTSMGTSKPFFLGKANSKAKTLVFYIEELSTKEDCKVCENELIRVKGVISITFNLLKKRCILRAKAELRPEVIVNALMKGKIRNVQQVTKDHKGVESFISFSESEKKENKNSLPEYLPEEDSPVKDNSVAIKNCGKEQGGSTWFSSACNFLARSFYW